MAMEYVINMVENLRLLRRGPTPGTNNNAVTVEDVMRTGGWGRITNNAIRIIILMIMILLIGGMIFLYIGSSVLAKNHPNLKNIDIQYTDIDFVISNSTVALEGKLTLQVSFIKAKHVKVYPIIANYILIKRVSENHTISAVSKSRYRFSQDEELMVLKLEPSPVHLEEKELLGFQESLDEKQIWVELRGDFKMKLTLSSVLVFLHAYHHIYFRCNMLFTDARPVDHINFKRCETLKEPQQ